MKNNTKKNKNNKKKCRKCCETCSNFVPIGEGDHICDYDEPVLILEDYLPTDMYFYCNGENYDGDPFSDDDDFEEFF